MSRTERHRYPSRRKPTALWRGAIAGDTRHEVRDVADGLGRKGHALSVLLRGAAAKRPGEAELGRLLQPRLRLGDRADGARQSQLAEIDRIGRQRRAREGRDEGGRGARSAAGSVMRKPPATLR